MVQRIGIRQVDLLFSELKGSTGVWLARSLAPFHPLSPDRCNCFLHLQRASRLLFY